MAVVVSAMGDTTDDLIELAKQVCGEGVTPPEAGDGSAYWRRGSR